MPDNRWEVETPEFRRTAYHATQHEGRPYLIAECESLVEGRWEAFVSLVPDSPEARWSVRLPAEDWEIIATALTDYAVEEQEDPEAAEHALWIAGTIALQRGQTDLPEGERKLAEYIRRYGVDAIVAAVEVCQETLDDERPDTQA